jgi:hypothetical protein
MSSNGSRLVASSYMGTVYTSDDYGVSWVSGNSIQDATAVAASADGNIFYVSGTRGAYLYTTATITKPKESPSATPTVTAKPTPKPTTSVTPKAAKATVTTKKIVVTTYVLTVRSGSPNSKYLITATKKGKNTYEYAGYTDQNGGASLNLSVNLEGYSFAVKIGN